MVSKYLSRNIQQSYLVDGSLANVAISSKYLLTNCSLTWVCNNPSNSYKHNEYCWHILFFYFKSIYCLASFSSINTALLFSNFFNSYYNLNSISSTGRSCIIHFNPLYCNLEWSKTKCNFSIYSSKSSKLFNFVKFCG